MKSLWLRQIQGILRLEVRKTLFSFRSFPVWVLASLPVLLGGLFLLGGMLKPADEQLFGSFAEVSRAYATAFQVMTLIVIYPGCVLIFMNLIRGEVLDRSLHYYFLAPLRREVLLTGKFIAGWISASLLFCASILVSMFCFFCFEGVGQGIGHLLGGEGLRQVIAYMSMTSLACLGFGAVFLIAGQFLKNPVIPALFFLGWEYFRYLLPPALKRISVLHYLEALVPIDPDVSLFAIITNPISPWIGIPGLVIFSAVAVAIAAVRLRRMEVAYGSD